MYEVYTETEPFSRIGFRDENNGTTSYYSSNITQPEAKFIDEWCQELEISPLNTRLFKHDENTYELLISSVNEDTEKMKYIKTHQKADGNGVTKNLKVTASDFKKFMEDVVEQMTLAKGFSEAEANNGAQKAMVEDYIEHFQFGDVNKHKDSQRNWIRDVGPVVETNIGYIETYLDPLGVRAEWEGFVAIVDKEVSTKFKTLVDNADNIICELPWMFLEDGTKTQLYEKPVFNKPDFTNLDIVAFGCSGTPIGINIPNYDDIRVDFGFKNVNLGNVYPTPNKSNIDFLKPDDAEYLCKFNSEAMTLIVALHELYGHGTGKLYMKESSGELKFEDFESPYAWNGKTKMVSETAYGSEETWSAKFGKLSSGYEECRADSVALFLIKDTLPFEIFCAGQEA